MGEAVKTIVTFCAVTATAAALAACGSLGKDTAAGGASPAASAPATAAAKAKHHHPRKVTYVVTGSTAEVTYGPAGSGFTGQVPMRITKKLRHPAYYSITAQLQGSGAVTCKIMIGGKVVDHASATGGYNIASCEISRNLLSGKWESTNS